MIVGEFFGGGGEGGMLVDERMLSFGCLGFPSL